jgi:hypothetical protein
MKREIDLSETESALLKDLLEQDQDRLNVERSTAQSPDKDEKLRRQAEVTRKTVDALSREPSEIWCEELLAWSSRL